ncbi:MAG: transcriptional activator NhaR [Planctomycetota bacterium]|nr:MAG: transcriptional activator NhaR [Planctomycetota bacterium]
MLRPDQLNFQHLRYFWAVVQQGSVTQAARNLHLTQSTISIQLRKLEKTLGGPLLRKQGRGVVPTELGKLVYSYAEQIFTLGHDLVDALRLQQDFVPLRFVVGALDVLPKLAVQTILEPLFLDQKPKIHLVVREGKFEQLLADLAVHRLDLVLSDRPLTPGLGVRAYAHKLGSSAIALFASSPLAKGLRSGFPKSLHQTALLWPTEGSSIRPALEHWFEGQEIVPNVIGEMEDSALLKTFGQKIKAVFPAPFALQEEICRQYKVRPIGVLDEVQERFFAISLERRVHDPIVAQILQASPFR